MCDENTGGGRFFTNRTFEDVIWQEFRFPQMWEREIASKIKGNDPTRCRAFRLGGYENVLFKVPNDAVINIVEDDETGKYGYASINGVDVHLLDGLELKSGGDRICCDVVVYVAVWEPKGARDRGFASNGRNATANYALCVDVHRRTENTNAVPMRLEILDTSIPENSNRIQRDRVDPENGVFSHISRETRSGVQRNQLIMVRRTEVCHTDKVKPEPRRQIKATVKAPPDRTEIGGRRLRNDPNISIGAGALAEQIERLLS